MSAGKKVLLIIFSSVLLVLALPTILTFAVSTNCTSEEDCAKKIDDASKKLSDLQSQADGVTNKITQLGTQLNVTQAEIASVQSDINDMEKQLAEINTNLADRNEKLSQKIAFRNLVIRNFSKRGVLNGLELLLTSLPDKNLNGFQYSTFTYMFEKNLTSEAVSLIGVINGEIAGYESDKKKAEALKTSLEKSQRDLIALKANQQNTLGVLSNEQDNLEKDLSSLTKAISALSATQQSIISAKNASYAISGYSAPAYKLPDPPAGYKFAVMSYGAYTHRNGMSQYGAKGRADAGETYEKILKYYYETGLVSKDTASMKIKVEGNGTWKFEEYLYGISEMESSWPMAALEAQAVAARTYAYNYAKNGKTICATTDCQVFSPSKVTASSAKRWRDAVDATKGKILDNPKTAQYSSTTGGWLRQTGWDTAKKDSWPGDAYEGAKYANSPWFYKAWYNNPRRGQNPNNTDYCGRTTPWLKESELVDILNAWVVWRRGSNSEVDRIVSTSCWGGNPYSNAKMSEIAAKYKEEYTSISKVYTPTFESGKTTEICFDTNIKKETCVNGQDFAAVFNLRAPAYVGIRTDTYGVALFDIEQRN